MVKDEKIWVAKSDKDIYLLPKMANRHGLIAGATGTGKTVTMKVLAESFSSMGVPVFFSDVKGDLSGMCMQGADSDDMQKRINDFGIEDFKYKAYPTRFWDIFGEAGHPVRVTVSSLGPMLLSRLLNLSEVQEGVLNIVFKAADDQGLLLLDMKDLRAMLQYVSENRDEYSGMYGNIATSSVGAIQRALLAFEQEDGEGIFGEPELDITDWIRTDTDGRGFINILSSVKLINSPLVYSTFLLWMLTELYERLPEVGDLDKPRIVFFFDEAHYLFTDTSKALVQKIEQVIKLVRSKGVGVYFVTQNPMDIPESILAQLSNRIQHGLRAYTPAEQKNLKAAARGFRTNEAFDTEKVLLELGTGEALVSFLDEKGVPEVVEKARILPPESFMGPADNDKVQSLIKADEFELKYRQTIDRESAYEIIEKANSQLKGGEAQAQTGAPANIDTSNMTMTERFIAEKNGALKETQNMQGMTMTEQFEANRRAQKQSTASKTAQKAVTSAASSVSRSLSTNIINSLTGGRTTSVETMGKRAATNALSSVMRSGTSSIIRGLFGNRR